MDFTTFIVAWFLAVLAMSGFSALWSFVAGRQFLEPILLSQIFTKTPMDSAEKKIQRLLGWIIHILLGAVFITVYELLWRLTGLDRTLKWSLVFGSLLGVLGILGWIVMFKFLTNLVFLNKFHFFVHLYFAHLVFSVVALFVYLA